MSLVFTPAALSFSITSRTISNDEWASRLAVGNDLDADHVARLEEMLPALDGVGGAGQLLDAPVQGRLDGGGVALAIDDTWPGFEPRRHAPDKAPAPRVS